MAILWCNVAGNDLPVHAWRFCREILFVTRPQVSERQFCPWGCGCAPSPSALPPTRFPGVRLGDDVPLRALTPFDARRSDGEFSLARQLVRRKASPKREGRGWAWCENNARASLAWYCLRHLARRWGAALRARREVYVLAPVAGCCLRFRKCRRPPGILCPTNVVIVASDAVPLRERSVRFAQVGFPSCGDRLFALVAACGAGLRHSRSAGRAGSGGRHCSEDLRRRRNTGRVGSGGWQRSQVLHHSCNDGAERRSNLV